MTQPTPGRFEEQDSNANDIVLYGVLRKDKSKTDRFYILYAQPLNGGGVARLEVYADEKAYNKKKSPKTVLLIKDIEKCEETEPNSSPSSRDLHRFVINFKNGDQFAYNCTSAEQQHAWSSWLNEFATGQPDVNRFSFHEHFANVRIVPADLALKTGLANGVSQACTLAFSFNDVGVFFACRHMPRFTVPIRLLRTAGYSGNLMHFQCGRRTSCGEGFMHFEAASEAEARTMKENLYSLMSRGVSSASPPVSVPSPSSSLTSRSSSNYPINIPADSVSMTRAITYNARPPHPAPGEPGSYPDNTPPRSYTEGFTTPTMGSGSVRSTSSSHRPRATALTSSMSRSQLQQQQQFGRQMSEPVVPNGASLTRQGSIRLTSASFGSESEHFMSPQNRKTMYEDMQHGPGWLAGHSGAADHQDTYEDMQPVHPHHRQHSHSRTNSTLSETGSSLEEINSRLSTVSTDSQASRRVLPAGLQEAAVPVQPGLYTNRSVQEDLAAPDDDNYVNVQPIRNQRSHRNKHLEVREKGHSDREYENVWVVINNPNDDSQQQANNTSAPWAIPQSASRRNSRASNCEVPVGSWHNQAVAATTQSPYSDSGVFHMDPTTPPAPPARATVPQHS